MSDSTRSGFGRRLGRSILWILSTALITFVLIVIIGGLAWGAFLGFEELRRSFNSMAARNVANEQKISLLRSDVDNLMAASGGVDNLRADVGELETRLVNRQEMLAADLEREQQMLAALEARMDEALDQTLADTAALSQALGALQGDINETSQRIDDLGGEVDQLHTELAALDTGVTDLQLLASDRSEDEWSGMQHTLGLFRVWGLIGRARLRLLENNLGLAQADVRQAQRALDQLAATAAEEQEEALQEIQTRLELALASLPNNPAMAQADLDGAWDALDETLAATVLPEPAVEEFISEEAAATATPAPTATP